MFKVCKITKIPEIEFFQFFGTERIKSDEKYFLFKLKSSFRSQDI